MQWDKSFLLDLSMNGPNVNLALQKRLQSHLVTRNAIFLDIGTCPLYTIHNGFSKGVREIDFDIDQFIVGIKTFFKLSSAHRKN